MNFNHIIPTHIPIVLGIVYSLVICHFARPIGESLRLMDEPNLKTHGRHAHPTPLVGGLAVIVPVVLLAVIASLICDPRSNPEYWHITPHYAAVIIVFMLTGMIDDRHNISALLRLVIGGVVYFLAILWEPVFKIQYFEIPVMGQFIPINLGPLSIPFSVLCLVSLTNAVNMSDGRNGIVLGLAIIWSLAFLSITPVEHPIGHLMLLGCLGVAFAYNYHGKLFLGDGGTYGIAACVGLAGIWFYNQGTVDLSITQLGCLFLVPGLDMIRLVISRIRRKISPFSPGHDHFHHYLDDWLGWKQGLPLYLGLAGLPVLAAFSVPTWSGEALLLGSGAYLVLLRIAQRNARLVVGEARVAGMP